jgi:hypothetical protein
MQRRIAAAIDACQTGEALPIELAWQFATEDRLIPPLGDQLPPDLELPHHLYVGVTRAAKQLATDKNGFQDARRKLATIEELGRYLPFRTTSLRIRFVRQHLLPHLFSFVARQRAEFPLENNESHALALASGELRAELADEWSSIDLELARLEPSLAEAERHLVFQVRVRGAELFRHKSGVKAAEALTVLLRRCRDLPAPSNQVLERLRDLYRDRFPRAEARLAWTKSKLYSAIDVGTQHTSRLKDTAKKALLEARPEIVRALPGHNEARKPKDHIVRFIGLRKTSFDPLLDKLVDRKAFQAFIFLRRLPVTRAA